MVVMPGEVKHNPTQWEMCNPYMLDCTALRLEKELFSFRNTPHWQKTDIRWFFRVTDRTIPTYVNGSLSKI